MTWKVLFFLFLWLFVLLWVRGSFHVRELFEPQPWNTLLTLRNPSDKPWERHPVNESLPLDHQVKYPNTFYYELDNAQYESALDKTFKLVPSSPWYKLALETNSWTGPYNPENADPSWKQAYATFITTVQKELQNSPHFCLPGETKEKMPIQIVHDRWRRFYIYSSNPNIIRIDVELVLYRESKYQGKHILMFAILEQVRPGSQARIHIVQTNVVGVIPSDQIGLHPVVPVDPLDIGTVTYEDNAYSFSPQIIMSSKDVIAELQRRRENLEKRMRASYVIRQTPSSFETTQS